MRYSLIIISEYLIESNQNSVHHLSCQAVRRTAYLKFCSGCMLKGFGLRTYLLDTEGWGPGLKILALTTSVIKIQCKSKFSLSCAHRSHKLLNHSIFVPPAAIYSLFHGFSSIYLRPSHLRCRWTNDMELVPKQFAWAGHANWLFSSYTEGVSFWSVLGTLSALEALLATMRYINWHLHYITYATFGELWPTNPWDPRDTKFLKMTRVNSLRHVLFPFARCQHDHAGTP